MPIYRRSDSSTIAGIAGANAAASYRNSLTPAQAFLAMVAEYNAAFPEMDPGVIVSLATAGIPANSQQAHAAARLDIENRREKGGGWTNRLGDFIAPVGRALGKPVGMVARGLDTALGDVDEAVAPTAKGAVRTAFVVLETGGQEVSNLLRAGIHTALTPNDGQDFWETYAKKGTSSGVETLTDLIDGKRVELGSGFLPGGEIEERVKEKAGQLELTVNGQKFGGKDNPNGAITLGRVAAANVVEPGSLPFNVVSGLLDAGVAWYADPAAFVGAAAKSTGAGVRTSRAVRAAMSGGETGLGRLGAAAAELGSDPLFVKRVDESFHGKAVQKIAGLIDAHRKTVDVERVGSYFDKGGRRIVEGIAGVNDLAELRRATRGKIPMKHLRQLADLSDADEVAGYLKTLIGTQELREAPEFLGFKVQPSYAQNLRLGARMPGTHIDPDNLDGAVEGMDRWLVNMKATQELRDRAVNKIGRTTNRTEMLRAVTDIMDDAAEELALAVRPGSSEEMRLARRLKATTGDTDALEATRADQVAKRAKKMTQLFNRDVERTRKYLIDEIIETSKIKGIAVNGEEMGAGSPYILLEQLNNVIPLPEAREIRRATSTLNRLVDNPFFEGTTNVLEAIQGQWKVMALARPAYAVRVIGEEQLRMAASGLDSVFNHPLSFISALVSGNEGLLGRLRQADVTGEDFFEEADEVAGALRYRLKDRVAGDSTREAVTLEFKEALHDVVGRHIDDKVLARENTLIRKGEDGYDRARVDALGEITEDPVMRELVKAEAAVPDVMPWFWSGNGKDIRERLITGGRTELATPEGAEEYLNNLWGDILERTGNDPGLLDALATGQFNGRRIGAFKRNPNGRGGRWQWDPEFAAYAKTTNGPEVVKGQKALGAVQGRLDSYNRAVTHLFDFLMARPSNYLSRSPAFRQLYWNRVEEMVPYMDDATRAQVLKNAQGVVDAKQFERMAALKANDLGRIENVDDVDLLAKGFALDGTKKLLYDSSERGQFFDTFRLVFPFGEAWKEVVTRWGRLVVENPNVPRRVQLTINGARGSGFFQKDASTGEEMFSIPLSGNINNILFGVPVPIRGRVAGLSILSEVTPGVGPLMQVPAAALIPEAPEWNFARKFLFPFGEPDYSEGLLETMLPGWAKRGVQYLGGGDQRTFNNVVADSMNYLMSTGNYGRSVEDQQRLFKDATGIARSVYLMRTIGSLFLPTAPIADVPFVGPDDHLMTVRVVKERYRELQKDPDKGGVGYDNADLAFLDEFGEDAFLTLQSGTMSIAPKLPVSKMAAEWRRANPELAKKYDQVWGLFAEDGPQEDIDYTEYTRQIRSGEREPLDPEQRYSLAQAKVGRAIYKAAQARYGEKPTRAQREALALLNAQLKTRYPGYGAVAAGKPNKADNKEVVAQLRKAITDPKLAQTSQAQGVREYLALYDRALRRANSAGYPTLASADLAGLRDYLRRAGALLGQRHAGFAQIFDLVFSSEVE